MGLWLMSLANKLSLLRVLLIPFFVISCAYYYHYPHSLILKFSSLGIFIIAVCTDALDGYAARKTRQKSKLGAFLDPMADKLLLTVAFICLFFVSKNLRIELPIWLLITVISRDVILTLGAVVIFVHAGHIEIIPNLWGKLTTISQMATIIFLFLEWHISYLIWPVMLILTIISGVDYMIKGSKHFNESSDYRPAQRG